MVVKASLSELADSVADTNYATLFYPFKLVLARIIEVKADNKIEVSLRESVVKEGYYLGKENVKQGLVVKGNVFAYKGDQALVQFHSKFDFSNCC